MGLSPAWFLTSSQRVSGGLIILSMFKVPYYKADIARWADHKEDVMSQLHENLSGYLKESEGMTSFHSTSRDPELSKELFKPFLEFIALDLDQARAMEGMAGGYPMPDISAIWYQSYTRNQHHELHNHGPIGWSAIFYAIFDKEEHRSTTFYAPFADVAGELLKVEPEVDEGTLLIFPSSLYHEAKLSTSDKQRAIISFNMFPKQFENVWGVPVKN